MVKRDIATEQADAIRRRFMDLAHKKNGIKKKNFVLLIAKEIEQGKYKGNKIQNRMIYRIIEGI